MPRRPIITLLTDFGLQDPFVGVMKGVILSRCREAILVDLCHDVPPFAVLGASLQLASAVAFFPAGTVHLVVVDPGVGGSRRPLVAKAGRHLFVAPDNGVLSHVLQEASRWRAWTIAVPACVPGPASATFHGRDVFAPVAGMLAAGRPPASCGPAVSDPVVLPLPRAVAARDRVCGEVVWIDRFGNCLTNIGRDLLADAAGGGRPNGEVRVGRHRIAGLVTRYEEAGTGRPGALIGSTGHLELFLERGNLSAAWGIAPGSKVIVSRRRSRGRPGNGGEGLGVRHAKN